MKSTYEFLHPDPASHVGYTGKQSDICMSGKSRDDFPRTQQGYDRNDCVCDDGVVRVWDDRIGCWVQTHNFVTVNRHVFVSDVDFTVLSTRFKVKT